MKKNLKINIYLHAKKIFTGKTISKKQGRFLRDQDWNTISDGACVYESTPTCFGEKPGRILWMGTTKNIPKHFLKTAHKNIIDLKKKHLLFPAFIDAHTHLVFGGDRSQEFALRCMGVSYETLSKKGGGILSTVRATCKASFQELLDQAIERVKKIRMHGVRVLEIKSGYGLDLKTEVKQLRVIQALSKKFPDMIFSPTFLGAHAVPKNKTKKKYIQILCKKMIPYVKKKKLAQFCDVFIDRGYFTTEEGAQILKTAKKHGFFLKIHAEELAHTGAADLGILLKAHSVDHLLKINKKQIQALANSNTVSLLLPSTAFYLKTPFPPARALLDQGAIVALATDFNPGSAPSASLPFALTLGALYMHMRPIELFSAITFSAAKALGLDSTLGSLEVGKKAIFTILPISKFEQFYYELF